MRATTRRGSSTCRYTSVNRLPRRLFAMSSLTCQAPPMLVDRDAFVAAVVLVCEQSFFMFAGPATPEVAARVAEDTTWFEVTVKFSGPYCGTLSVAIPEALATDLFAAFLGFDQSDVPALESVEDLMGEFANMACGTWLSELTTTECFGLEHPV